MKRREILLCVFLWLQKYHLNVPRRRGMSLSKAVGFDKLNQRHPALLRGYLQNSYKKG